MSRNSYYVYLLVEVSGDQDEIFYVGKGIGARGGAHLLEYVRATLSGEDGEAALRAAHVVVAPDARDADSEQGTSSAELSRRDEEEHAKVQRMRRARSAGNEIRVDLLRTDLAQEQAYAIESAVIDAIGLDRLTNLVHGHSHGRVPALAAMRVLDAEAVTIEEEGYQVVVSGVWGGGNTLSGLLTADEADVWENARQSWAISARQRKEINDAARRGEPYVLVAVAKGPSSTYGGIILGLWEIEHVQRASARVDRHGRATEGWAYVAAPPSPRLRQLRDRYLHRRSTHARQVGPTRLR